MKFVTHQDEQIDTNGSHRQGYIKADYKDLVELFGRPYDGDGHKVDWEWNILFEDGSIATIYNWKSGPNYGYYDVGPGHIKEWNVGGFSQDALNNIRLLLANKAPEPTTKKEEWVFFT